MRCSSAFIAALVGFVLVIGALGAAIHDDGSMTSAFVQVAHRHGARSPITPQNSSVICGPLGCGMLNQEGKRMLVQAGAWLRNRYPGLLAFTDAYSPNYAYTRSTSLARTLQSADGMLHGIFPDNASFFPVIDTVTFFSDVLLLVDALPAYHVPQQVLDNDAMIDLDAFVLQLLDRATLAKIGTELSLNAMCANTTAGFAARCALACQDIAASREAEGAFPSLPYTAAHYAQLNAIRFQHNFVQFAYNSSDADDLAHGSYGQNLAQRLISNMKGFIKGDIGQQFIEYSAHDTTMIPLCTTLGYNNQMLPLFGQMYVFELAFNTTNASVWGVRAYAGSPPQVPGPYAYTMNVFPLNCVDSNGTEYTIRDESEFCPIDDLWRFINKSLPQNPQGLCYVSDAIKQRMNCGPAAPAVGDICWFYRYMCPQYACAGGTYLDMADFSCKSKHEGVDTERKTLGIVAALTALGGLLIGLVLGIAAPKLVALKSNYQQLG